MPSLITRLLRFPTRLPRRLRRRRCCTMLLLLLAIPSLLLLTLYSIYKPPRALIAYLQYAYPAVLWRVALPPARKLIALTIDDMPSQHTENILNVLRAHNAKATFFVIGGQVAGREDLLVRAVREGHELGNHAMHDEPSARLSDADLRANIAATAALIQTAYDNAADADAPFSSSSPLAKKPPRWFRPGSGFFSARLLNTARELGYRVVLGDVYPHDAQMPWERTNAQHVLSMVRPGSVVICHDRRAWTPDMLRRVLPRLKMRGYEVMTVSGLVTAAEKIVVI